MRILLADDDPTIRMIVMAGLRVLGHDVTACESGGQAWAAYQQSHFQVVITDWSMPEMDGIQLTDAMRKVVRPSYTYVIMLTGHSSRAEYLAAIKAGVDAFLVKPLDGALLEAQVSIASRIVGLQDHAKRLESILTMCPGCKRVRSHDEWMTIEEYVTREFKKAPAQTFCPTCEAEGLAKNAKPLAT